MWDRNSDRAGFIRWDPNIYLEDGDRAVPFTQRLNLYRKQNSANDTHESPIKIAKPRATPPLLRRFKEMIEVKAIADEALCGVRVDMILEYDKCLHIMNSNDATDP